MHQVTAHYCGHFAVAELIRGCTEQEAKRFLSPTPLVYQTLCNFLRQKCTDLEEQRLDFNIFSREQSHFQLSSSSVPHTVCMYVLVKGLEYKRHLITAVHIFSSNLECSKPAEIYAFWPIIV